MSLKKTIPNIDIWDKCMGCINEIQSLIDKEQQIMNNIREITYNIPEKYDDANVMSIVMLDFVKRGYKVYISVAHDHKNLQSIGEDELLLISDELLIREDNNLPS